MPDSPETQLAKIYEVMQREWGISFDYIEDHWDDVQFAVMTQILSDRFSEQARANAKADARARRR